MKNIPIVFIIVTVFVFTWDLFWWAMGVEPILPYRLKKALIENPEGFYLIDVRTQPEYKLFHIDGARNHPGLSFHPDLSREQEPGKPVVVICMTGHRSPFVAYQLKKRGFGKVYNLTWGMLGWFLSGGESKR